MEKENQSTNYIKVETKNQYQKPRTKKATRYTKDKQKKKPGSKIWIGTKEIAHGIHENKIPESQSQNQTQRKWPVKCLRKKKIGVPKPQSDTIRLPSLRGMRVVI